MVYLKIMGNCGNQFFQYAFARVLQEKYGGQLVIDYSEIHNAEGMWESSDNLLKEFNTVPYKYTVDNHDNPKKYWAKIIAKLVKILRLKAYTKRTYRFCLFCAKYLERFGVYYFSAAYYPFKFGKQKDVYVNGYFESPRYFEEIDDIIIRELSPKAPLLEQNRDLFDIICNRESVCISIKRRSVEVAEISSTYYYDINYFYNAVKYIKERVKDPVWIIFSDNIQWCKDNFKIDGEVLYETDGNTVGEKIRLMSACKHFIIHNSTFSWWVQHLSGNKDKIVISPVRWMLRDDQPIDIYEDHFVYMTNDGVVCKDHL